MSDKLAGERQSEAHSTEAPAKLRFAVVVGDGDTLPWWQAACVRAARASGEAELVAVVDAPPASKPTSWRKSPRTGVLAPVWPAQDWPNIPRWSFDDERSVTSCDFVLGFSEENPIRKGPPLGVWEFRIGGFVAQDDESTGSRELICGLQTITTEWVAMGLGTSVECTLHHSVDGIRSSPRRTFEALVKNAAGLCVGAIRRLRRGDPLRAPVSPAAPVLALRPGWHSIGAAWLKHGFRRTTSQLFKRDIWTLGVLPLRIDALITGGAIPQPIWFDQPQPGTFHADPFPVTIDGEPHVLFELWCDKSRRGWIATCRLDDLKGPVNARKAIDLGCHMSYPFVFQYDGKTWCTPEVSEVGGLRILRMGNTAEEWTVAHVALPHLRIVDPTLLEHDGRWWLFACLGQPGKEGDLLAWYAASPFSEWTAHPLNPIKSDITSARPAGALFRFKGRLYRPGQDCAQSYGRAVVIHQILRLDLEGFDEIPIVRLQPGKDWASRDGLHTINVVGERIILDAKRCVTLWPFS